MPYIIDGNNLVGSSPDISLDDPEARAKILYIVRQYQNNRKNNVVIVFDGDPGSDEINGVPGDASKFSIVYSRHGNSADNEIKGILDRLNYYKDVTLVTSDKNLKSFAKKKGVKTVNSIEFYFELKRLSRIHGKKEEKLKRIEVEVSDTEVDQWMKIFDDG
ncbi:MAG: hypothetical protein GY757_09775 [bacterium]|nr:hypothetical protein [bacterium]